MNQLSSVEMAKRMLEISLDSFTKNAEYRGISGVISFEDLIDAIDFRYADPVVEIVGNNEFRLKYHVLLDEAYLETVQSNQEINDEWMQRAQFLHLDRNYVTSNVKTFIDTMEKEK